MYHPSDSKYLIPNNVAIPFITHASKDYHDICDRIWENPPYGIFSESWVWCMVDKLYRRANPRSSLRPIVRLVVEIQRFVCNRATPQQSRNYELKALLCTRMAFPHTAVTRKSIKWTWAEPFEMNVKIEQEFNFVVDGSWLFLDAQEAKRWANIQ